MVRAMVENGVGWIPAFLEWLDARLTEVLGERWWVILGRGKN
jgi:hypothetical protein